ncbi:hypothetical protein P9B42_15465 [Bacillus safensis]|uniref:hypothetical protein n=1 Tax=Bacillus safensis TaxID=561879 RepID=UPI002DBB5EAC|nr:hypothetical protein [Bacillus safensis]MEC0921422.1 hypothetical protein [Bacillus safensis]MEC0997014.1 hypothetical protein [Bacillus safensis]MEC1000086.1 hypothetical protein [Bacillus safensis]
MSKFQISFDHRREAQERLEQAGGWIDYKKGQPVFNFPNAAAKQKYIQLGQAAYHQKVGM